MVLVWSPASTADLRFLRARLSDLSFIPYQLQQVEFPDHNLRRTPARALMGTPPSMLAKGASGMAQRALPIVAGLCKFVVIAQQQGTFCAEQGYAQR